MSTARTRCRLPHTLAALGVALTGGSAVACGGIATDYIQQRGSDGGGDANPPPLQLALDAGADRVADAAVDGIADAAVDRNLELDADASVQPGQCEEGLNTAYPPSDCSGPSDYWLATPYRPAHDITLERIVIHTTSGSVALLSSGAAGPGALLFQGTVGTSSSPEWLGTNVSPAITMKGGELYYLAFVGSYCSQARGGPEPVEYGAASLDGPWTVTGTDNWTARLIGTCQ